MVDTFTVYDFKFKYKYKYHHNVPLTTQYTTDTLDDLTDLDDSLVSSFDSVYDFKFKYKYKYFTETDEDSYTVLVESVVDTFTVYDFKFKYKYKAYELSTTVEYLEPPPFICVKDENDIFNPSLIQNEYSYDSITFEKQWQGIPLLPNTFYMNKYDGINKTNNGIEFNIGSWGINNLQLLNLYIFNNNLCVGENIGNLQNLHTIEYQDGIYNPTKDTGTSAEIYIPVTSDDGGYTVGIVPSVYVTFSNTNIDNADITGTFIIRPNTSLLNKDFSSYNGFVKANTMIFLSISLQKPNIQLKLQNEINVSQIIYPEVNVYVIANNIIQLFKQQDIHHVQLNNTTDDYLYIYSLLWYESITSTNGEEMICADTNITISNSTHEFKNVKPGGFTYFNHWYKYKIFIKDSVFGEIYETEDTIKTLPPIPINVKINFTKDGILWSIPFNTTNDNEISYGVKRMSYTINNNTESFVINSKIYNTTDPNVKYIQNEDHENLLPTKLFEFQLKGVSGPRHSKFSDSYQIIFNNVKIITELDYTVDVSRNPIMGEPILSIDSFGNLLENENQFVNISISNEPTFGAISTNNIEYHIFEKYKLIGKVPYTQNLKLLYLGRAYNNQSNIIRIGQNYPLFINVALFDTSAKKYYAIGDTIYISSLDREPAPITGSPDINGIGGQNENYINWSITDVLYKEWITEFKLYLLKHLELHGDTNTTTINVTEPESLLNDDPELIGTFSKSTLSYTHNPNRTLKDTTIYVYRIVAINRDGAYLNNLVDISNSIIQLKTNPPTPAIIDNISSTSHKHSIDTQWTLQPTYSNDEPIFYKCNTDYTTASNIVITNNYGYIKNSKTVSLTNLLADTSYLFTVESFTHMGAYIGNVGSVGEYNGDTSGNKLSVPIRTNKYSPNYINNFNSVLYSFTDENNIIWQLDICENYTAVSEWRQYSENPNNPTIFYLDDSNAFNNGDIIAVFNGNSPHICLDTLIWDSSNSNKRLICSQDIIGANSSFGISTTKPYFQVWKQNTKTIHPLSVSNIEKFDSNNEIITSFSKTTIRIDGGPTEATYRNVQFVYATKVFSYYENGYKINSFTYTNTDEFVYTEIINDFDLYHDYNISLTIRDPLTYYSASYTMYTRNIYDLHQSTTHIKSFKNRNLDFEIEYLTNKFKINPLEYDTQRIVLINGSWNLLSFYVKPTGDIIKLSDMINLSGHGLSGSVIIYNQAYDIFEYDLETNTWTDDEIVVFDNGYYIKWIDFDKSNTEQITIEIVGNIFKYVYLELTRGFNFFFRPFTYIQSLHTLLEEYLIVNGSYNYDRQVIDHVVLIITPEGAFIEPTDIDDQKSIELSGTKAYIVNVDDTILTKLENIYELFNIDVVDNTFNPLYTSVSGEKLFTVNDVLCPDLTLIKNKPYIFSLTDAALDLGFEYFLDISSNTLLNRNHYTHKNNKTILFKTPIDIKYLYYGSKQVLAYPYAGGNKKNNMYLVFQEVYHEIINKTYDYTNNDESSEYSLFELDYQRTIYFRFTETSQYSDVINFEELGYFARKNDETTASKSLFAIISKNADSDLVHHSLNNHLFETTINLNEMIVQNVFDIHEHIAYFHLENIGDTVEITILETFVIKVFKIQSLYENSSQYKIIKNASGEFEINPQTNTGVFSINEFITHTTSTSVYYIIFGSVSINIKVFKVEPLETKGEFEFVKRLIAKRKYIQDKNAQELSKYYSSEQYLLENKPLPLPFKYNEWFSENKICKQNKDVLESNEQHNDDVANWKRFESISQDEYIQSYPHIKTDKNEISVWNSNKPNDKIETSDKIAFSKSTSINNIPVWSASSSSTSNEKKSKKTDKKKKGTNGYIPPW